MLNSCGFYVNSLENGFLHSVRCGLIWMTSSLPGVVVLPVNSSLLICRTFWAGRDSSDCHANRRLVSSALA